MTEFGSVRLAEHDSTGIEDLVDVRRVRIRHSVFVCQRAARRTYALRHLQVFDRDRKTV